MTTASAIFSSNEPKPNRDPRDTAFHEAGHIAVGLCLRRVPVGATIEAIGDSRGAVLIEWPSRESIDTLNGWIDLKRSGIGS